MKTRYLLLPTICLLITVAALTAAQTPAPADPPAVLQIFREEIKQGKNALHETVEVGYVQAFTKAKWPTGYLGMTSVSGTNEAWFLVPFDSFAAFEKDRQGVEKTPALQRQLDQLDQQDGEFRTGVRVLLAVYRKDISGRARKGERGCVRGSLSGDFRRAKRNLPDLYTYEVAPGD